jgi:heterotetrameric sarcosine oxidase gamma subunit
VSNFRLAPASSLGARAVAAPDHTGVTAVVVTERVGVSLCSVIARKSFNAQLADLARAEFGVELPRTPRSTGPGTIEFIWAGPNQWLALSERDEGKALEQRLRSSLGPAASITDQSDGRTIVRVAGPRLRDVLAKGVHIDLHPCAFKPGDTAITTVAYINVHFWQVDDTPTYDITIFRSFAVAFWEWLCVAIAEV